MLQISVWGNSDLSVHVPVRPDGMISMPLIGDVKAEGKTPRDLKAALEKELKRYVKAPVVSVTVTAINSFKVYVFGDGVSRSTGGPGDATGPVHLVALKRFQRHREIAEIFVADLLEITCADDDVDVLAPIVGDLFVND